jgi:Na+-driven multidrug efflux pump
VKLQLKEWSFEPKILLSLLALGLPAFIGNGGIALTVGLANKALSLYGGLGADLLISAYGVVSRIAAFIQLPLIGMMIGYQTIAGYNYGARRYARVLQMVRLGLLTATAYTVICSCLMIAIPEILLRIFTSDEKLIEHGAAISRIIFIGVGLSGASIMGGALFQALGKAKAAMFLSTVKVFLVLAPLLLWLPARLGTTGIWYAFPIADVTLFAVVALFVARQYTALCLASEGLSEQGVSAPAQGAAR